MKVRPRTSAAKKSPVGLVVVLVAIAAVAVGGWHFFLRSGPEKAVTAYLKAVEAGDVAAVKAALSAESLRLAGATINAANLKAGFPAGATYAIASAKVEGEKATVPVKFTVPSGAARGSGPQQIEMPFAVVREGGEWKMDLMATATAAMNAAMNGRGGPRRSYAPAVGPASLDDCVSGPPSGTIAPCWRSRSRMSAIGTEPTSV